MTIWHRVKTRKTEHEAPSLRIDYGVLYFFRANDAVTIVELDDLALAELRVCRSRTYWYLVDRQGAEALIPETIEGVGSLRRYLASWRGFNYDALLRFQPESAKRIQLWPA